jgi:hypothetical protein
MFNRNKVKCDFKRDKGCFTFLSKFPYAKENVSTLSQTILDTMEVEY